MSQRNLIKTIPVIVETRKGVCGILAEINFNTGNIVILDTDIAPSVKLKVISAVHKKMRKLKNLIKRGLNPAIDLITDEIFF